ncbi:hypothetical protein [Streptomyces sp. NPDC050848]|uniref:hypothetical protein n=1 Tax=Streptomyces sp. NPDC050848 TaxID=3155791 RepID=UPI003411245F
MAFGEDLFAADQPWDVVFDNLWVSHSEFWLVGRSAIPRSARPASALHDLGGQRHGAWGMDVGRSTRRWSLDEKNWSRGWWIPLVVVLATATWGFLGFAEGDCKRGPRGGCVAADGYELRSWVLFLASMPTLFVVGTGLTADR